MVSAGKPVSDGKRGKGCNRWLARENVKGGKTSHGWYTQKNV